MKNDPLQRENLWSDRERRRVRDDLVLDLMKHLPQPRRDRLPVAAPT